MFLFVRLFYLPYGTEYSCFHVSSCHCVYVCVCLIINSLWYDDGEETNRIKTLSSFHKTIFSLLLFSRTTTIVSLAWYNIKANDKTPHKLYTFACKVVTTFMYQHLTPGMDFWPNFLGGSEYHPTWWHKNKYLEHRTPFSVLGNGIRL